MTLNENIKQLRLARNLSQVDLAKALGVTKQSVSNWENNNIQPSIDMLIRISGFFSVSTDYMLGLEERKFIEINGLSETQLAHIRAVIDDIPIITGNYLCLLQTEHIEISETKPDLKVSSHFRSGFVSLVLFLSQQVLA